MDSAHIILSPCRQVGTKEDPFAGMDGHSSVKTGFRLGTNSAASTRFASPSESGQRRIQYTVILNDSETSTLSSPWSRSRLRHVETPPALVMTNECNCTPAHTAHICGTGIRESRLRRVAAVAQL